MYAIITDGSRQYKVETGQELNVDYRDTPAGEKFKFESVLAVRRRLATPSSARRW